MKAGKSIILTGRQILAIECQKYAQFVGKQATRSTWQESAKTKYIAAISA